MRLLLYLLLAASQAPAPPRELTAVVDSCSTLECKVTYLVVECLDQGWKGTRTLSIAYAPTEFVASFTETAEVRCSALRTMFSDSDVAEFVEALYPIEDLPHARRPIARLELEARRP